MCQPTRTVRSPLPEDIRAEAREDFRALLRERNLPATPQRMAIYDVLLETNAHICAEHILDKARARHPGRRMNKTTVYRTLDILLSLGLVYEMKRDDGRAQYEHTLRGPHGHLICRRCERIEDLDLTVAAMVQASINRRYGFQVDLVGHALPGLCSRCRDAVQTLLKDGSFISG
jgi:Fe2+ or Zn2+ uptake regulation protein